MTCCAALTPRRTHSTHSSHKPDWFICRPITPKTFMAMWSPPRQGISTSLYSATDHFNYISFGKSASSIILFVILFALFKWQFGQFICVLSSFFVFYHKSKFAIGFPISENLQTHTSFMFLPCLVKKIWTFFLLMLARRWRPSWIFLFLGLWANFEPCIQQIRVQHPSIPLSSMCAIN